MVKTFSGFDFLFLLVSHYDDYPCKSRITSATRGLGDNATSL